MKLFGRWLLTVAVVVMFLPATAMAEATLTGVYEVFGWEPGTPADAPADYSGTAEIVQRGELCTFTAQMDGQAYEGKGICDSRGAAFLFRGAGGAGTEEYGVTRLLPSAEGLSGQWVYGVQDSEEPGRELWNRR